MKLTPGTRLGPFEILSPLGAGGMGEVYRARDTRLERTVAIKILSSELVNTPGRRVERFRQEARAKRETAEELQVHQFGQGLVDRGQLIEGVADVGEFTGISQVLDDIGAQRGDLELAPATAGALRARVIDDQAPHDTRGVAHEVRFVGKHRGVARGDVQVGFMKQRGHAKAAPVAATGQLPLGQPVQFRVERAEQGFCGGSIAAFSGGPLAKTSWVPTDPPAGGCDKPALNGPGRQAPTIFATGVVFHLGFPISLAGG